MIVQQSSTKHSALSRDRSHECNVLTDPLNLSALALPTRAQCIPIFYCYYLFYFRFSCTGSNLAALDGGIAPLPLATVPEIPRVKKETMRFDKTSSAHESFNLLLFQKLQCNLLQRTILT